MKDKGMLFMSKLPEKDFLHTEAFQWPNRNRKEEKEKPVMTIVVNKNLEPCGYLIVTCIVVMTLTSTVMGLVTILGQLGIL